MNNTDTTPDFEELKTEINEEENENISSHMQDPDIEEMYHTEKLTGDNTENDTDEGRNRSDQDTQDDSSEEDIDEVPLIFEYSSGKNKKTLLVIVIIIIFIGIPILLTLIKDISITGNKIENATDTKAYSGISDLNEASDWAYDFLNKSDPQGRFQDIDELTNYIRINIISIYSSEQLLHVRYTSGNISGDQFINTLSSYRERTYSINRLLLVNHRYYIEEDFEEEYQILSEDIERVMLYEEGLQVLGQE